MRKRSTVLERLTSFLIDWLQSRALHQTPIEGQPARVVPEQKRRSLNCALETDLYPRAGRLKGCGLGWRVRHGQLYAGSGEGQSCVRGSEVVGVEREAASQSRNAAADDPLSTRVMRTGSPPPLRWFFLAQFMTKRSMSKAVERRSMK